MKINDKVNKHNPCHSGNFETTDHRRGCRRAPRRKVLPNLILMATAATATRWLMMVCKIYDHTFLRFRFFQDQHCGVVLLYWISIFSC